MLATSFIVVAFSDLSFIFFCHITIASKWSRYSWVSIRFVAIYMLYDYAGLSFVVFSVLVEMKPVVADLFDRFVEKKVCKFWIPVRNVRAFLLVVRLTSYVMYCINWNSVIIVTYRK